MYSIQTDFFNDINSESKAYILAWFWNRAHGHIQLMERDQDALFLIQKATKYTGKVRVYNQRAELNITIPAFCHALQARGCVPHKRDDQSLPTLPPVLMRHFMRGIFDSYGALTIPKGKYLNISIIHNEYFITCIRKLLLDELNISTKHYYRYTHTTTMQMMITQTSDAKKFLDWLYLDANCYLARKFLKFQKYDKKSV